MSLSGSGDGGADQATDDLSSLPLPEGADDSRNALSDVGLLILANPNRIRPDPQPLSSVTESHSAAALPPAQDQPQAPNDTDSFDAVDSRRTTGSTMTASHDVGRSTHSVNHSRINRSNPAQEEQDDDDDDDDDLIVPEQGLLAGQVAPPAGFGDVQSIAFSSARVNGNGGGGGGGKTGGAHSLASFASMPSFGGAATAAAVGNHLLDQPVLPRPSPESSRAASFGRSRNNAHGSEQLDDESATQRSDCSASGSRRRRERSERSDSVSAARSSRRRRAGRDDDDDDDDSRSRTLRSEASESATASSSRRGHRSSRDKSSRHSRRRRGAQREQTFVEYQEEIRRKVKQQEDIEKREMLLLFYEKKRYENLQVPEKFFRDGMDSDLQEMRWWYYKLIRDTRINDAVSSMKHNIVQVSRFGLFLNSTIGNPLNLRLDKEFPAELANTLDTDLDRHLREHIKSKCGVSGPKPNPMRHILQGILECGWNYHRNRVAMEESERKRQEKAKPPAAAQPVAQVQHQQQQQQQQHPFAPQYSTNMFHTLRSGGDAFAPATPLYAPAPSTPHEWAVHYQRLLQQQHAQRVALEQQRPIAPPPAFQPNRQPLREAFRNMTPEMRRHPLPEHLRPPRPPSAASAQMQQQQQEQQQPPMSLAEASRAMREHIQTTQKQSAGAPQQPPPPTQPRPPAKRPSPPTAARRFGPMRPPMRPLATPSGQKKTSLIRPPPPPVPPAVAATTAAPPKRAADGTLQPMRRPPPPPLMNRFASQSARPLQRVPSVPTFPTMPVQSVHVRGRMPMPVRTEPALRPPPPPPPPQKQQRQQQQEQQQQQQQANNPMRQPSAVNAVPATGNASGAKKSLDELMSELESAYHDDDDCDSLRDEELDSNAQAAMPAMDTQDRLTDALSLMEGFGSNASKSNNNLASSHRPTLYDIDDILGENASSTSNASSDVLSLEQLRQFKQNKRRARGDVSTSKTVLLPPTADNAIGNSTSGRRRRRQRVSAAASEPQSNAPPAFDGVIMRPDDNGDDDGQTDADERATQMSTPPPRAPTANEVRQGKNGTPRSRYSKGMVL